MQEGVAEFDYPEGLCPVLSFTLDTNCIIAVDEGRPEAVAIRLLADAHSSGNAQVAIAAITASEKQVGGGRLENFADFQQRLTSLHLDHLELLRPMFYWDVTFWDWSIFSDTDPELESLEREIHETLFPAVEFLWLDYCAANGIDSNDLASGSKWRNYKCDVQALWSHIFYKRDVFVTSDNDFHAISKRSKLKALGVHRIETPQSAALLVAQH